jgi:RecB family exonuclease
LADIQMEYLSHSRLEVFNACPRLFHKRYILRDPEENETTTYYGDYGSNLHGILEKWYQSHGFIGKTTAMNMYLNGYELDGEFVKGFSDIGVPDTYSKKFGMTNSDLYFSQGTSFIESLPLRDTSKTIGTEVEFNFSIHPDIPNLYGFIDRVDKDERGYVVTDYKSSAVYSQRDCDKKPQMTIYAMAVKELFGEYPYEFRYEFVRFNETRRTYRTVEQIEQHKQEIMQTWDDICNSDWEPKYNYFYCRTFCPYNSSCDLYKSKERKGGYVE